MDSTKLEENPQEEVHKQDNEYGCLMQDDVKREKLLKLLGGKKAKNETDAERWIENARSTKDEIALLHGIESQFHNSLKHSLQGRARRHEGVGFSNEEQVETSPGACRHDADVKNEDSRESGRRKDRSRSRSPLTSDRHRKRTDDRGVPRHHESAAVAPPSATVANDSRPSATSVSDKKSFYMQFKKSSDS